MISGVVSLIYCFVHGRTFEEEHLRYVLGWILLLYFLFLSWDSFSTFVASPVPPSPCSPNTCSCRRVFLWRLRKTTAPGVGGALQKVGARSSRGLLKAPLLGSALKFPEEIFPPPLTSHLLVFKISLVRGLLPKM